MYRLTNKKGNVTTIRIVRDENNACCGCIGTVKDLIALDLLMGTYPSYCMDKWLFLKRGDENIQEFSTEDEIKAHLGITSEKEKKTNCFNYFQTVLHYYREEKDG